MAAARMRSLTRARVQAITRLPGVRALTDVHAVNPAEDRLLKQVRYVPRRIEHHARHSGYDILFPHMGLKQPHIDTDRRQAA